MSLALILILVISRKDWAGTRALRKARLGLISLITGIGCVRWQGLAMFLIKGFVSLGVFSWRSQYE